MFERSRSALGFNTKPLLLLIFWQCLDGSFPTLALEVVRLISGSDQALKTTNLIPAVSSRVRSLNPVYIRSHERSLHAWSSACSARMSFWDWAPHRLGFRFQGLGFRVYGGLGFKVKA